MTRTWGSLNCAPLSCRSFPLNYRPLWVTHGRFLLSRSSHSSLFASSTNMLTSERVLIHPYPLYGALNCHSRSAVLPQPLKAVMPQGRAHAHPWGRDSRALLGCLLSLLHMSLAHTAWTVTPHLSIVRLILLALPPLRLPLAPALPRTAPSPCPQGPAAEDLASEAQKNEAVA